MTLSQKTNTNERAGDEIQVVELLPGSIRHWHQSPAPHLPPYTHRGIKHPTILSTTATYTLALGWE
jgi:hypothetical protein